MNNRLFAWLGLPAIAVSIFALAGCANSPSLQMQGGYGYTPVDPLPVNYSASTLATAPTTAKNAADGTGTATDATKPVANSAQVKGADLETEQIFDLLADTAMRMAVVSVDSSVSATYAPVKFGTAGNRYQIVLDYIQYTTRFIPVQSTSLQKDGTTHYHLQLSLTKQANLCIPVYIGVGFRLTANVSVLSGQVDLTNLVALGAAAQAKQIQGTLVVQTMGLAGVPIESAIPIPSTLDQSTIQSALMALGTIKSKIHDPKITVKPRAVAVYNPFKGSDRGAVDAIVSLILADESLLTLTPSPGLNVSKEGGGGVDFDLPKPPPAKNSRGF